MLIKKEIHILLKLGTSPDKDVFKLMGFYDDVFIDFVKNNQNNILYKS
jgi:hypothetical protein|tara:strand:- start:36 stop:179 length:144 start_codon:yes stop_codon:yes gene_type:complete